MVLFVDETVIELNRNILQCCFEAHRTNSGPSIWSEAKQSIKKQAIKEIIKEFKCYRFHHRVHSFWASCQIWPDSPEKFLNLATFLASLLSLFQALNFGPNYRKQTFLWILPLSRSGYNSILGKLFLFRLSDKEWNDTLPSQMTITVVCVRVVDTFSVLTISKTLFFTV